MLTVETVRSLVQRAILAPSSHNTQPWRFRATETTIDLLADWTRALPVNDPFDRELVISCGGALMTLRIAVAASGLGARVQVLPDAGDGDCLARVEVTAEPPDAELEALGPFIEQRRTYRKAFGAQAVAADAMASVTAAAAAEGASLLTLDDAQRQLAGSLVAEGDRAQWSDPRWRRELAMWMHRRRDGDGLSVPALAAPIAQAVVRTFDMGNGVAAKDHQLLLGSPWLAVLTTSEDDTAAWLLAGQALQRAMLVGCLHGLQASYLNQPIEVAPLRERLRSALGTPAYPQLLIRWGHPTDAAPAAPRRPVDAVIEPSA
ncbi:MAG: Acg family FMN-binding oxidoreductase [Sphingomonadaceae bacterium]